MAFFNRISRLASLTDHECNRMRLFLRHMGLKCRKVGMVSAKADADVQEAFKTTQSL